MILAVILLLILIIVIVAMCIIIFGAAESIGWTKFGRERLRGIRQLTTIAEDVQKKMQHPYDEEYFDAEKEARDG